MYELAIDINFDLEILNSAVKDTDGDLEICVLGHFVEKIYKNSNELTDMF